MRPAPNARHRHPGGPPRPAGAAGSNPYDFCIEEAWCTDLLLARLQPAGTVLDPACGIGTVVEACRRHGLDASGSDIADRGYGRVCTDFLDPSSYAPGAVDHVVTNPPYYGSEGIVAFGWRGLTVARRSVCLLVPLGFLASQGRNRLLSRDWPVSHALILSRRCSMPPGDAFLAGEIRRGGGKTDYCWLVLSHGWAGPPELGFLL